MTFQSMTSRETLSTFKFHDPTSLNKSLFFYYGNQYITLWTCRIPFVGIAKHCSRNAMEPEGNSMALESKDLVSGLTIVKRFFFLLFLIIRLCVLNLLYNYRILMYLM